MNFIKITFEESEAIADRKQKMKDELQPLMPLDIIDATYSKEGYPDREYGYGDEDLMFADSITITYERRIVQKCRKCGCYDTMACMHPKLGPCWWVKSDLCSHCAMEEAGKITGVLRPWLPKNLITLNPN